ncbi:H-type lectin domain-containing protein [Octadecabacter temperatus]|uniref:H-type lectin domain protein n=1 Tax=Octadecabacter temperatus TaxID=1458307 RepID=A0A0K0Y2T7_9RHOB|nr:H-type lectin domain-containing protein [Octadecabacter temperatus]AKS45216.1 H-type lectin domain protein [Octadecabacter temperatus]SIN88475.1 H-type lectin domain-containing protein [Octadecabacter temperatus]
MKRLRNHLIGVDHGDVVLFSDFEHDGVMWTGEGARQTRAHVEFPESFRAPPAVQVNLSMWDMASDTNARADVQSEDITNEGFAIVFRTWGDTKIARVRVAWQAIGELRQADEWDVY